MVIKGRHGPTQLDNIPCLVRNRSCAVSLDTPSVFKNVLANKLLKERETLPEVVSNEKVLPNQQTFHIGLRNQKAVLNSNTSDTVFSNSKHTCPNYTSFFQRSQAPIETVDIITSQNIYDVTLLAPSLEPHYVDKPSPIITERTNFKPKLVLQLDDNWDSVESLQYLEQKQDLSVTSKPSTSQYSTFTGFSATPSSTKSWSRFWKTPTSTTSHSSGFKFTNWRVFLFLVIVLMCFLCDLCVCGVSASGNASPRLPWYLEVQVNESVGATSAQCLSLAGSDAVDIVCGKKTDRMALLRKVNTKFCGLPVYRVLSKPEKDLIVDSSSRECASILNNIEHIDGHVGDMFCSFTDILDRVDCLDSYSNVGTCEKCRESYKQWLCALHLPYYNIHGEQVKPCIEFCDHVSTNCPFFKPYGDLIIGERGFLCKDINIDEYITDTVYGPKDCCSKPCQLFESQNPAAVCPPDPMTSNCTAAPNHATSATRVTSSTFTYRHLGTILLYIIIIRTIQMFSYCNCLGLT